MDIILSKKKGVSTTRKKGAFPSSGQHQTRKPRNGGKPRVPLRGKNHTHSSIHGERSKGEKGKRFTFFRNDHKIILEGKVYRRGKTSQRKRGILVVGQKSNHRDRRGMMLQLNRGTARPNREHHVTLRNVKERKAIRLTAREESSGGDVFPSIHRKRGKGNSSEKKIEISSLQEGITGLREMISFYFPGEEGGAFEKRDSFSSGYSSRRKVEIFQAP